MLRRVVVVFAGVLSLGGCGTAKPDAQVSRDGSVATSDAGDASQLGCAAKPLADGCDPWCGATETTVSNGICSPSVSTAQRQPNSCAGESLIVFESGIEKRYHFDSSGILTGVEVLDPSRVACRPTEFGQPSATVYGNVCALTGMPSSACGTPDPCAGYVAPCSGDSFTVQYPVRSSWTQIAGSTLVACRNAVCATGVLPTGANGLKLLVPGLQSVGESVQLAFSQLPSGSYSLDFGWNTGANALGADDGYSFTMKDRTGRVLESFHATVGHTTAYPFGCGSWDAACFTEHGVIASDLTDAGVDDAGGDRSTSDAN